MIPGTVEVSKGCLAPTDPMVSHILGPLVSPGPRGGSRDGYRRKLQEQAVQVLVPWSGTLLEPFDNSSIQFVYSVCQHFCLQISHHFPRAP